MRIGTRPRNLILTIHVTTSVGWIGALAAYLVLDVAAATTADPPMARAAYAAMELITLHAIVPLAAASCLVGVINAICTPWGLIRHYWVLAKLVLTVFATVILLVETRTIRLLADMAATMADPTDLPGTLLHSGLGLAVLVAIATLAIYKPPGLTRYGWRRRTARAG